MRSVVISLAALLAVAGCTSGDRTPLIVYSPHGKELLSMEERLFEEKHPEVDVRWLDMGSQDVYDRIRTERAHPQADIWWGAPMTTFARAEQENLLERYVPTWDSAVSAEFKSPGGYWYGTFITPEVIMYNTNLVPSEEAPRDWDDLLDARWRGRMIIRSPLASGTMRILFSAMILREAGRGGDIDAGFRWLRRLDANTKSYVADPTQLYLKIAREEGSLTVWDLPDVLIQKQLHGYPFGYVVPRSGTPLITDCIAIVRGTEHRPAAIDFYEFVTSTGSAIRQAQEFWRIPARRDIPRGSLPAWVDTLHLTPLPVDWAAVAANERDWMRRWDERVKGTGTSGPEDH